MEACVFCFLPQQVEVDQVWTICLLITWSNYPLRPQRMKMIVIIFNLVIQVLGSSSNLNLEFLSKASFIWQILGFWVLVDRSFYENRLSGYETIPILSWVILASVLGLNPQCVLLLISKKFWLSSLITSASLSLTRSSLERRNSPLKSHSSSHDVRTKRTDLEFL